MRIAGMETFPVNVAYRHAEVSSRVRRGGVTSIIVKLQHRHRAGRLGRGLRRRRRRLDRRRAAGDAAVRAGPQTRGTARPSPATSTAPGCGTTASRPATSPSPASTWRSGTCAGRIAASRCTGCSAARCGTRSTISTTWPRARRTSCAPSAPTASSAAIAASTSRSASMRRPRRRCSRPCGRPSGRRRRIRIDANEAWSVPEAVRLLERWHDRFGIDFAEAPVPIFPLDRMRDLRAPDGRRLVRQRGAGQRRRGLSGDRQRRRRRRLLQQLLGRHAAPLPHAGRRSPSLLGIGVCKHTHGELGIAAAGGAPASC